MGELPPPDARGGSHPPNLPVEGLPPPNPPLAAGVGDGSPNLELPRRERALGAVSSGIGASELVPTKVLEGQIPDGFGSRRRRGGPKEPRTSMLLSSVHYSKDQPSGSRKLRRVPLDLRIRQRAWILYVTHIALGCRCAELQPDISVPWLGFRGRHYAGLGQPAQTKDSQNVGGLWPRKLGPGVCSFKFECR